MSEEKRLRERIAALEAELATAKAEVASWAFRAGQGAGSTAIQRTVLREVQWAGWNPALGHVCPVCGGARDARHGALQGHSLECKLALAIGDGGVYRLPRRAP